MMSRDPIISPDTSKKPAEPKHRPMPEDPQLLAKAMFDAADRKIATDNEGRAAEKPAAQER